jgi:hypothetical protein
MKNVKVLFEKLGRLTEKRTSKLERERANALIVHAKELKKKLKSLKEFLGGAKRFRLLLSLDLIYVEVFF